MSPHRPKEQLRDQTKALAIGTQTQCLSLRRPKDHRRDHTNVLAYRPANTKSEPTPTKRTEGRAAPSLVVPAATVSVRAQADKANRGVSSALTCRARYHNGWLCQRRSKEKSPEQRPHLSFSPPQWLTEPSPTRRTEARVAPSHLVHVTTVAVGPTPTKKTEARSAP